MAEIEGAIKFDLQFQLSPLEQSNALDELLKWRDVFFRLGAIGQDPKRYDGYAYGNISCRLGGTGAFIVSGTQTGQYEYASLEHFTCIDSFDVTKNKVVACGPIEPSSESLTHGAIYALNKDIRCVVHGHIPQLWSRAKELEIPSTPADVPYGTPQMAEAISKLYKDFGEPKQAVFAMQGHEDGVIAYASDFKVIEKILRNRMPPFRRE